MAAVDRHALGVIRFLRRERISSLDRLGRPPTVAEDTPGETAERRDLALMRTQLVNHARQRIRRSGACLGALTTVTLPTHCRRRPRIAPLRRHPPTASRPRPVRLRRILLPRRPRPHPRPSVPRRRLLRAGTFALRRRLYAAKAGPPTGVSVSPRRGVPARRRLRPTPRCWATG